MPPLSANSTANRTTPLSACAGETAFCKPRLPSQATQAALVLPPKPQRRRLCCQLRLPNQTGQLAPPRGSSNIIHHTAVRWSQPHPEVTRPPSLKAAPLIRQQPSSSSKATVTCINHPTTHATRRQANMQPHATKAQPIATLADSNKHRRQKPSSCCKTSMYEAVSVRKCASAAHCLLLPPTAWQLAPTGSRLPALWWTNPVLL